MLYGVTNDTQIRRALLRKLVRRHSCGAEAFVVEELPVARGSGRVDVAVVNGHIEGFEIKSSKDTLERLPRQMILFGGAFDRMSLIAASKHVEEAMKIVPEWWSIFEVRAGKRGAITLLRERAGRLNPTKCPRACVSLLERDELVSLLSAHSLDHGYRTATWLKLAERVVKELDPKAIASGVLRQLKNRIVIEARFSKTAFGASASGGGFDRYVKAMDGWLGMSGAD